MIVGQGRTIALFFLVLPLLSTCGEKIEPGATPQPSGQPVKTVLAVVRLARWPLIYEAVGTVQAQTASTLSSKLMGTVREVRIEEGRRVKKGELLVSLDSRQVRAQLEQAEAALAEALEAETGAAAGREEALAAAAQAESTFKRYRTLIQSQVVTREQFEAAEARFKETQAAVARANATIEAARFRVKQARAAAAAAGVTNNDAWIRAPYDGKITAKLVEVGDLAAPGTPFLALENEDLYRVDLILPESYIQNVDREKPVSVTIEALSGKKLEGRVETIVPEADQKSRTFLVKVALPRDGALRSGMFARVAVPVGEDHVLAIPLSAIVSQGQLTGVYIVDEKHTARFRLVRTGRRFGDQVEALSGIEEGQRLVLTPPPQLTDGARVEGTS